MRGPFLRILPDARVITRHLMIGLLWAMANCGWVAEAQIVSGGVRSPFVPIRAETLGASSIDALLQSSDGHLWIADGQNLLRFDGKTVVRFNPSNTPGLKAEGFVFNALAEDLNGDIWAGTSSSGVVHVHDGKFETIGEAQGLPANRVNRVDLDAKGRVWIFTSAGAVRFEKGQVVREQISQKPAPLLTDPEVIGLDGRLQGFWRKTPSGVELFSHGEWKPFRLPKVRGTPAQLRIRAIYEDRLQRVWYSLTSFQERYFCLDHGHLLEYDGVPPGSFVSYRDSNGYLWLNDHKGRAAIWKDGKVTSLPAFDSTNLLHVIERPDGGFWVGTIGSALFELRPRRFALVPTPGAPVFNPSFFRQKNGSVWVGDVRLQRWVGNKLKTVEALAGSSQNGAEFEKQIGAFGEDGKGTLLLGTNHLIETFSDGKRVPDPRFTSIHARVRSFATSSDGTIWMATASGLFKYSGTSTCQLSVQQGLPSNQVTAVYINRLAQLWVGTTSGAVQFRGSNCNASLRATFGDRSVRALAEDSDAAMWIAFTDGTFKRVDPSGSVRSFGAADGLPVGELGDIWTDDPGYVWLTYESQLLRIERHVLLDHVAGASVSFRTFDNFDGLPNALALGGNLRHLRFDDGTLWFSTGAGITSVRPTPSLGYADHPHATVEESLIDGVRSENSDSVRLNANFESLRVSFGAPGVTQPEKVQFRFRLQGYDPEWSKAGLDRSAFYSHLPAGTYTMEVQATALGDDRWRTAPAMVAVVVSAPWYARKSSRVALGSLCAALLIGIALQRRKRQLQSAEIRRVYTRRLTESQELERKRLAGELHDSLGQQLVIIRSMAMQPALDDDAKAIQLHAISEQAVEAIHELEDISYALRPYQLDRLGLTKALDALICVYRDKSAVTVLHHVEDIDSCLPHHLQIDLYRIVQEGMNNALRHSEATEIQVRIWADKEVLHCVIADNGVGFVRGALDRVGLGLAGIEERAESAGGTAEILTAVGSGTKITIRIKLEKQPHK